MGQDTNIQVSIGGMTTPRPLQRGVITIDQQAVPQFGFLDISNTTVQGDLRKDGTFAIVHQLLKLPESYSIIALFFDVLLGCWKILVESDAIPVNKWGETSLPELELTYGVIFDQETGVKTPYLSTIQAHYKCRALSLADIFDPKMIQGWKSGERVTLQQEEK